MGQYPCVGEGRQGPMYNGRSTAQAGAGEVTHSDRGNGRAQGQVGWNEVMDGCGPAILVASASSVNRKEGHQLRMKMGRRCVSYEREKV